MNERLQEKLKEMTPDELARLYKTVFESDVGQLVLEDLRNRCFVYMTSFRDSSQFTAFNEGMRAVVLHLETQLRIKPEEGEI